MAISFYYTVMAVLSPNLIRGLVSTLQALLALAMITAGVFDRVKTDSNVSRIVMPIWTGFLVSIQTAVKKTLNDLRLAFVSRNMLLIVNYVK